MSRIIFNSRLIIFLIWGILPFSLSALDLPQPYRVPEMPVGGIMNCQTCSGRNRAVANQNNPGIQRSTGNMTMTIPLVETDFLDIGNLLTVKQGGAIAFRPGEYFMVMPPGTENASYLVFRQGSDKISFKASSGTMSDMDMTTPDEPTLKLLRDGDFLIVRNHGNLQDYVFESATFSDGWRLREIRRLDAPEIKLCCQYGQKSGLLEEIILPGNISGKLIYNKDGSIAQFRLPDGEYTKFDYDSLGNIKTVETFLKPEHPLHPLNNGLSFKRKYGQSKDFCIRSVSAEYDTSGKLLKVTDENGKTNSAEYRLDTDRKTLVVTRETVITEPDGEKRYFVRETDKKNNIITTREGRITRKNPKSPEKRSVLRERVLKLINNTYTLVSDQYDGIKFEYQYNAKNTNENVLIRNGKTFETRYNVLGLPISFVRNSIHYEDDYDSAGRLLSRKEDGELIRRKVYDETGKIIQETLSSGISYCVKYAKNGVPEKIVYSQPESYDLIWDDAFRLKKAVRNDGLSYEFEYAGTLPLLRQLTMIFPGQGETPDTYTFRFAYDPKGRLIQKIYFDGTSEYWSYNCCDLTAYKDRLGEITQFVYDEKRHLVRLNKSKQGAFKIHYNAEGRRSRIVYPDETSDTWQYDERGNVLSETYRDGLKITREFNSYGKPLSEQYSNGRKDEWFYNEKGDLLSKYINGFCYQYDENGTLVRIIKSYPETPENPKDIVFDSAVKTSPFLNTDQGVKILRRNDGLIEKRIPYDGKYTVFISKKLHGSQLLMAFVPIEQYDAAQTEHERDELLEKYKKQSYFMDFYDNFYETYKEGNVISRMLFTGKECSDEWRREGDKMVHFLAVKDYLPDGSVKSRFVKAQKKRKSPQ